MQSTENEIIKLAQCIDSGERRSLAKAITLIESERPEDRAMADELLRDLANRTQKPSIRIAISGPPGVGKSSFIEELGKRLTKANKKVAILAVDPSSPISGGSILGDRTRMPELSANNNAFIRPSPTRGHLGGVARRTRESITLCEAAGYEWIIVETVGVGQSEIIAWSMVDIFITLQLPNSGDELQGIKRGILELSDLVVITKADGDSLTSAKTSQVQLKSALPLLAHGERGIPEVLLCSSKERTGFEEIEKTIGLLHDSRLDTGLLDKQRENQTRHWFEEELNASIMSIHLADQHFQKKVEDLKKSALTNPRLTGVLAREAAKQALNHGHA